MGDPSPGTPPGVAAPGAAQPITGAGATGGAPNVLSPTRYLAWLYSTPAQKAVFGALCEIESEVAGSLRPGMDHHVAHTRLQWWQDECERFAKGQPVHPLTKALAKAQGAHGADVDSSEYVRSLLTGDGTNVAPVPNTGSPIAGFVNTAVWDLAGATFETRKELAAYCERWGAAMFASAAARVDVMRGGHAAPTASLASASAGESSSWGVLGAAVREVELLANLGREAHAGRIRVPLDELEKADVDTRALAKTPWAAGLATLLRARHESLRERIAKHVADIGSEEQARLRGLLVWAALAWHQSLRAQRMLPNAVEPKPYHAFSEGWRAWRVARRANAGKLRL